MTSQVLLKDFRVEMTVRDSKFLRIMAITYNMAGGCPSDVNELDHLF